ncbi:uncharacterized protein LOC144446242 [Glandiceps talaboti]
MAFFLDTVMRIVRALFTMADVVIFYGPPFAGKSAYCEENYTKHKRISAQEIFQNESSACLRQIILQIVNYLRDGHKVVIDDENWSDITRASYINTIKTKIPWCTFQCVKFHPREKLQVYWAREWALAELCMTSSSVNQSLTSKIDMCQSDDKFNKWFSERKGSIKTPQASEGFTIKEVETHLIAKTYYKFEIPALFVQWQSIIQFGEGKTTVVSGVSETLNLWYKVNPCGRIIIINDGKHECDSQEEHGMKTVLSQICNDMNNCVLYFCIIDDEWQCGQFAIPPSPGLVAWLQRIHHLQLKHSGTLYLTSTATHAQCAEAAGINHMMARTVFSRPAIVNAPYCATKGYEPTVLQDMKFCLSKDTSFIDAKVPLFDDSTHRNFYKVRSGGGRFHGICCKSYEVLGKYQELYEKNATPISETVSRVDKLRKHYAQQNKDQIMPSSSFKGQSNRSLPKWLVPKSQRVLEPSGSRSGTKEEDDGKRKTATNYGTYSMQSPRKKLVRTLSQSVTVYCMNELELVDTAKMVLKELDIKAEELSRCSPPATSDKVSHVKGHLDSHVIEIDSHMITAEPTSVAVKEENEPEDRKEHTSLLDEIFFDSKTSKGADNSNCQEKTSQIVHTSQTMEKEASHHHSNLDKNAVVADSLVPETVSCIPETVVPPSSITSRKKNLGPDLTFLDDIF